MKAFTTLLIYDTLSYRVYSHGPFVLDSNAQVLSTRWCPEDDVNSADQSPVSIRSSVWTSDLTAEILTHWTLNKKGLHSANDHFKFVTLNVEFQYDFIQVCPHDPAGNKSSQVLVTIWCRQAPSHYLKCEPHQWRLHTSTGFLNVLITFLN